MYHSTKSSTHITYLILLIVSLLLLSPYAVAEEPKNAKTISKSGSTPPTSKTSNSEKITISTSKDELVEEIDASDLEQEDPEDIDEADDIDESENIDEPEGIEEHEDELEIDEEEQEAEQILSSDDSSDSPAFDANKRETIGWVERIRVVPGGALLDAKLTPGSEGNVLHAEKITTFKKNKKRWVRFETQDRKGNLLTLEHEIIDVTKFRTTDGSVKKRYVIKLPICISTTYIEIDFSLSNRNKFEQEVRIGRSSLAGQFLIDPAKTKTTKPKCVAPTAE